MVFSKRLRELRKNNNTTQQEIADYLGIKRNSISRYENGNREPDQYTLNKLSEYFNVSVDYLLGNSNIRNPEEEIDKVRKTLYATFKDDKEMFAVLEKLISRTDEKDMVKDILLHLQKLPTEDIKTVLKIIKAL